MPSMMAEDSTVTIRVRTVNAAPHLYQAAISSGRLMTRIMVPMGR